MSSVAMGCPKDSVAFSVFFRNRKNQIKRLMKNVDQGKVDTFVRGNWMEYGDLLHADELIVQNEHRLCMVFVDSYHRILLGHLGVPIFSGWMCPLSFTMWPVNADDTYRCRSCM